MLVSAADVRSGPPVPRQLAVNGEEIAARDRSAGPRRALAAVRGIPVALAILLLLGLGLRIALGAAYGSPVLNLFDTVTYVGSADGDLFGDPLKPAGYPMVLAALHAFSSQVEVTLWFQHGLGIATALLLYAIVRRARAPVWAALLPASGILLSLDQVFLEHALMAEALFTFVVTVSLYAGVRSLDEPRQLWGPVTSRGAWIAAVGVGLGLSTWIRPASLPLIPLLGAWVLVFVGGPARVRIGRAALVGASGAALVLGYFAWNDAETGTFGFTAASGWAVYSRAAPFADCAEFEPPPDTRVLCEQTPPDHRPGGDFYSFDPGSPAVRAYGPPPAANENVGAFGRAAILGQPTEYAKDVVRDFIRYFHSSFRPRPFSGPGYDVLDVDRRAGEIEVEILNVLNEFYADEAIEISDSGIATLGDAQDVLRVHPKLMLAALILALAGVFLTRGAARAILVLLLAAALGLLATPVLAAIAGARYSVPAAGPLLGAGAIGAWVLAGWVRTRYGRASPEPG